VETDPRGRRVSPLRSTILNMLEYMGAWEWYDRQVKLTQTKHEAERKKPLARKLHVLRDLRNLKTARKSIKGIGRLTWGKGRTFPQRMVNLIKLRRRKEKISACNLEEATS